MVVRLPLISENNLNFSGKVFLDGVPLVPPRGGPLTAPELPPKIQIPTITPSAIPEPESYSLLLAGLCIVGMVKRRRLA
ncbi:PEP-CTERM sorting domain-containing protein [Methylophilus sp. Leaf408]|uniref:PEP-CTERM sorting domain-containing protein n=1 Tax=Methylophilus sp. Leaf408 TaxID=2876561 RepID=UPI00351DA603